MITLQENPVGDKMSQSLGIDHLLNEEDKNKLKNMNNLIKAQLDDITDENHVDGYLYPTIAHQVANKLSDEMTNFSKRLVERKMKERIQDLATTSTLPPNQDASNGSKFGGRHFREQSSVLGGNTGQIGQNDMSGTQGRNRGSSFNNAG